MPSDESAAEEVGGDDRSCPVCGETGKDLQSIGTQDELEDLEYGRFRCTNSDCKVGRYRHGRRVSTDGGESVSRTDHSVYDPYRNIARTTRSLRQLAEPMYSGHGNNVDD